MNFDDIRTFTIWVIIALSLLVVGIFVRSARANGRLRKEGERKRREFEAKYAKRKLTTRPQTYKDGHTTRVTSHHPAAKESQTKWRNI